MNCKKVNQSYPQLFVQLIGFFSWKLYNISIMQLNVAMIENIFILSIPAHLDRHIGAVFSKIKKVHFYEKLKILWNSMKKTEYYIRKSKGYKINWRLIFFMHNNTMSLDYVDQYMLHWIHINKNIYK